MVGGAPSACGRDEGKEGGEGEGRKGRQVGGEEEGRGRGGRRNGEKEEWKVRGAGAWHSRHSVREGRLKHNPKQATHAKMTGLQRI